MQYAARRSIAATRLSTAAADITQQAIALSATVNPILANANSAAARAFRRTDFVDRAAVARGREDDRGARGHRRQASDLLRVARRFRHSQQRAGRGLRPGGRAGVPVESRRRGTSHARPAIDETGAPHAPSRLSPCRCHRHRLPPHCCRPRCSPRHRSRARSARRQRFPASISSTPISTTAAIFAGRPESRAAASRVRSRRSSPPGSRCATTTRTGSSRVPSRSAGWRRGVTSTRRTSRLDLGYAFDSDLQVGVSPLFGWAFESGAKTSDALTYGAILAATKVFSPSLMLGAGVGIVRQIDDTKVFPFLIVNWQIDDRWRLGNPFPAGPAGGAGLELTYAPDDRWEFAGGGAKRSTRYRLDETGIAPGGIGENRFFPLFARVVAQLRRADQSRFLRGRCTGRPPEAGGRQRHHDRQGRLFDRTADRPDAFAPVLTRCPMRRTAHAQRGTRRRRRADRAVRAPPARSGRTPPASRAPASGCGDSAIRRASTGISTGRGAKFPICPRARAPSCRRAPSNPDGTADGDRTHRTARGRIRPARILQSGIIAPVSRATPLHVAAPWLFALSIALSCPLAADAAAADPASIPPQAEAAEPRHRRLPTASRSSRRRR